MVYFSPERSLIFFILRLLPLSLFTDRFMPSWRTTTIGPRHSRRISFTGSRVGSVRESAGFHSENLGYARLSVTTSGTFLREFSPLWTHASWAPRMLVDSSGDVGERLSIRNFGRCFHTMSAAASASCPLTGLLPKT